MGRRSSPSSSPLPRRLTRRTAASSSPSSSPLPRRLTRRTAASSSPSSSPLPRRLTRRTAAALQIRPEAVTPSDVAALCDALIASLRRQLPDVLSGAAFAPVAPPGALSPAAFLQLLRCCLVWLEFALQIPEIHAVSVHKCGLLIDLCLPLVHDFVRRSGEDAGAPASFLCTVLERMASDFLSNYIFLSVGRVGSSTELISQRVEFVRDNDKSSYLMDLLHAQKLNGTHGKEALTLVFVETKRGADQLENWLSRNGFPATSIHGDRCQREREQALRSFKSGSTPIMVATDVAARGLDIPHVSHVINFDLPKDIDDYVHRIGRTGRAGKSGVATAFFSDANQPLAKALVELMQEANQDVPEWLVKYSERFSYGGGRSRGSVGGGGGRRFGGRDFRRDTPPKTGSYNSQPSGKQGGGYGYGSGSGSGGYGAGGGNPKASHGYGFDHQPMVSGGAYSAPHSYGYGNQGIVATGWD